MANIKSAKKRIKVIDKKTARNARVKNHVKAAVKAFLAAIEEGNAAEAEKAFQVVEKKLMQASAKGTFHKNTVSRKISRFERKLNALRGASVTEEPAKKAVKTEEPVKTEESAVEEVAVNASMKKDELLAIANERGIEVPAKATKAEIIEAIEAK